VRFLPLTNPRRLHRSHEDDPRDSPDPGSTVAIVRSLSSPEQVITAWKGGARLLGCVGRGKCANGAVEAVDQRAPDTPCRE
jgi:hypothetical protein